jgi:putative oxygen-independent coproporphyrinogen III oxidase
MLPTAAYIHIPFCRRRCFYCDFPIAVVGDKPPVGDRFHSIAQYIALVCREIAATPNWGQPLQTVFFGGGTPSLLEVDQLGMVLDALRSRFQIASDAEISMEIDPDTFDLDRLKGYAQAGVNRVSLGVQSFHTDLLKACGRTHTSEDVERAIALIHHVGLTNFSVDLISGLPHLTMALWQETLERAIALSPPHISVYDLTIEPNTSFDRWYAAGTEPLPSDTLTAEMYRTAQQMLTAAGYDHYEISNYARSGYQCRHNRVYWENRPYYGFGMAAASYTEGQRFNRPRTRSLYAQWVNAYVQADGKLDCEVTSELDQLLETFMLGLRLAEGVDLSDLSLVRQRFDPFVLQQVIDRLHPYVAKGWVQCGDRVYLSDPEGFLFSNVVLADLFEAIG